MVEKGAQKGIANCKLLIANTSQHKSKTRQCQGVLLASAPSVSWSRTPLNQSGGAFVVRCAPDVSVASLMDEVLDKCPDIQSSTPARFLIPWTPHEYFPFRPRKKSALECKRQVHSHNTGSRCPLTRISSRTITLGACSFSCSTAGTTTPHRSWAETGREGKTKKTNASMS